MPCPYSRKWSFHKLSFTSSFALTSGERSSEQNFSLSAVSMDHVRESLPNGLYRPSASKSFRLKRERDRNNLFTKPTMTERTKKKQTTYLSFCPVPTRASKLTIFFKI